MRKKVCFSEEAPETNKRRETQTRSMFVFDVSLEKLEQVFRIISASPATIHHSHASRVPCIFFAVRFFDCAFAPVLALVQEKDEIGLSCEDLECPARVARI